MSKLASNGSSRNSVHEVGQYELSRDEMSSASFRKYSADSLSGTTSDNFVSDNDSWESDTDCYEDGSQYGGSDQKPREKKESIRLGSLDSGVDIVVNPEDNDEDEKTDGDFGEEFDKRKCPLRLKWCECYQLDVTLTSFEHGVICPQTGQRKIQSILRAEPQIFTIITTEKKKRYRKKSKNQMDNSNIIGNSNGRPRKNVRFINLPDECKIPERDGKTSKKSGKIPVPTPSDQINKARKTLGVLKLKITGETTNSVPLLRSIHSSHYATKVVSPKAKRPVHNHHHHHHHGSNSSHKPKVLAGPTFFHKTVKLVKGNAASRKTVSNINKTSKVVTYGDLKLKMAQKSEQTTSEKGEVNISEPQDLKNENSFNYCNPGHINSGDAEVNQEEAVNKNEDETETYSDENSVEDEEESEAISDENGNIAQKENMDSQEKESQVEEDEVDEDLQRLRRSRRKALGYHIRQIQVEGGKQSTESSQQRKKLSKGKKSPIFSDFTNTKLPKNNNNNDGSGTSGSPNKIKKIISISKQLKQQENEKKDKSRQNSPARIVNTRYRRDSSFEEFPQFDF